MKKIKNPFIHYCKMIKWIFCFQKPFDYDTIYYIVSKGVFKWQKPKKKYENLSSIETKFILKQLKINSITEIETTILKKLKERLKVLKDVRVQGKIKYKLWDIL